MPKKMVVGKNKFGNPRELAIPLEIYGANNRVVWKEYEVKNRHRDSRNDLLFDLKRSEMKGHNLIYDAQGRIVGGTLTTHFTKGELTRLMAIHRTKQKRFNWQNNILRRAGITLRQIEIMKAGQEVEALKLLLRDGFFGTAIMTGRLVIPEDKSFSIQKIKDLVADYFLDAYIKEKKSRKKSFTESARTLSKHTKEVTLK